MKLYKIFFLLIIIILFQNCKKEKVIEQSQFNLIGGITGYVKFTNEFNEKVLPSEEKATIILEGESLNLSVETDSTGFFEFNSLPFGTYDVTSFHISQKYSTCKKHQFTLTESSPKRGGNFPMKGIPDAYIEMFRIDSFVDSHHVFWKAVIKPETEKTRVIRFYYGNDRMVTKDNYVYTSQGGGFLFSNDNFDYLASQPIDINAFSQSGDSIYIAAYVAAHGYERCYDIQTDMFEYSPVAENPFIISFPK